MIGEIYHFYSAASARLAAGAVMYELASVCVNESRKLSRPHLQTPARKMGDKQIEPKRIVNSLKLTTLHHIVDTSICHLNI